MAFAGITIPGASSSPPVTISASSGDILTLAAQISQLLGDVPPANLLVTEVKTGATLPAAPAPVSGDTTELALNGPGGLDTSIPGGYTYVGVADATADTLSGTNIVLVTDTVGGTYNVSGTSTVAATGGNNTVNATGSYVLSFGPGNNQVIASGSGTIATGSGHSTVVAANTSGPGNVIDLNGTDDVINTLLGNNTVNAAGNNSTIAGGLGALSVNVTADHDLILAGAGSTTVEASGTDSYIAGSGDPGTSLTVADSGQGDTVNALSSSVNVTTSGSNAFIQGGAPGLTLTIDDTGSHDVFNALGGNEVATLAGSGAYLQGGASGPSMTVLDVGTNDTINALASGVAVTAGGGSTGLYVNGGSGPLMFVGGANPSTVYGSSTASTVTSGLGGVYFVANGDFEHRLRPNGINLHHLWVCRQQRDLFRRRQSDLFGRDRKCHPERSRGIGELERLAARVGYRCRFDHPWQRQQHRNSRRWFGYPERRKWNQPIPVRRWSNCRRDRLHHRFCPQILQMTLSASTTMALSRQRL